MKTMIEARAEVARLEAHVSQLRATAREAQEELEAGALTLGAARARLAMLERLAVATATQKHAVATLTPAHRLPNLQR